MPSRLTIDRANRLVHNKKHFDTFEGLLRGEKEGTARNYRSVIINLLEYFDKRSVEITNVEDTDIAEYAATQKRGNGSDFRGALVKFFNTVKAPRFHMDSLAVQESNVDRKAKTLSASEIVKLRNKLTTANYYKLLFTFEMFYLHGVTLDEIEKFRKDKYSESDNTFTFLSKGKSKQIILSKVVIDLINKHPDLLDAKGRTTYSNYMKDIGTIVEFEDRDKIIWQDIDKTRTEDFPICSLCKEKYPNSDEFWALIQFEEDIYKKNWLYCRDCANTLKEANK